jgi:REP-associated tyrosine transposase
MSEGCGILMSDGIREYRRFLPHWRMEGAIYFVTWRLNPGQHPLTAGERTRVATALQHFNGERYTLFAYVVMDDHVHLVVEPLHGVRLERLVHSWKSYTAARMQRGDRKGRVWQREYFDRIIRDDTEFNAKVEYVLDNPYQRWPGIDHYPWTWCRRDLIEGTM